MDIEPDLDGDPGAGLGTASMSVETKSSALDLEARIGVLKALADRSRIALVNALLERPHCAEELAERLKLAPSTVSFHLRKLEEARLVTKERTQYYLVYRPRAELLALRLQDLVASPAADGSPEKKRLERSRERVIRAHFRGRELLHLPKRWKDRRIVLEELLDAFEPGREYPEAQVDERLRARFPDYCTLRRLLVDEGYLARKGGIYRLVAGKEGKPVEPKPKQAAKRSEQIRAYKETPLEAGVYRIVCRENGKTFLGSAKNLRGPLNRHKFMLSIGMHPIRTLQEDFARSGADAFSFEVVAKVERKDEPGFDADLALERLEREWVAKTEPFGPRGYNVDRDLRKLIVAPPR